MRALVSVVVFLTAVFTASALVCHMCMQSGTRTDCTGGAFQAPAGVTKCIWGMENNTLGDSMILTPFRYILDPSKPNICGDKLVLTCTGFDIAIGYQCCDTDDCNDGPIKGTYQVEDPNGYVCPSCFSETDTEAPNCIPVQTIECRGKQTECLTFNGTATRPDLDEKYYSFQGCVSTDGCKKGIDNLAATRVGAHDIDCTPANKKENTDP